MSWLEHLIVSVEHRDLLTMDTESLVCPVTVKLGEYGKISKTLFRHGGDALLAGLSEMKDVLPDRRLDLGQAVSLNCKPDYHIGSFSIIIFVALWAHYSEYGFNLFYKAYINSLREAFRHNLKSIALPIMAYDGNIKLCSQAIVKVIQDLDGLEMSSGFSTTNVHFVSDNPNTVEFLRNEVDGGHRGPKRIRLGE